MSARSIEYCRRVRGHLAALGSPRATLVSVPVPTVLPVARAAMISQRRAPQGAPDPSSDSCREEAAVLGSA